jgi:CMP/dCMP kinase
MGTVVFPDARLKVFLTASVAARANRRHKQLMEKGISTNIASLARDLEARDARDSERATAPLKAAPDAYRLDSSELGIDEVAAQVLRWFEQTESS